MTVEHLDVLIVGAGLSGIGAAHYLQTDSPWATYAIFEGRERMGGTWDLFRYPGIRSDSDMQTLGYSFRPWTQEKSIADGASILQYIKDTAAAEGIDDKIRYQHKVVAADWSTEDALWHVTAERGDTGETVQLTAGFVVAASGYYRYDRGHEPEFAGRDDFAGTIVHPQFWPEDLDYAGKKVVVIGSGATAITLVPSMAEGAGHVTMLQRSPTWIASVPESNPIPKVLAKVLPDRYAAHVTRWLFAVFGTQMSYHIAKRRPQVVAKVLRKGLERQLPEGYDIDTHFTPRYDPWDERLCAVPDGDLFKAIRSGAVDVVTDRIERFTETGIQLESGAHLDADIIVTATGLEILFLGGMQVTVDGEPVDVAERLVYKGMMLEGVPNIAAVVGYTNASWTLKADLTSSYVARLINHLRATGMRQATPTNSTGVEADGSLLGLNSGYLNRATDRLPKQGSSYPWRVYQSYLMDYRAMRSKPVVDEGITFSNPVPAKAPAAPALEAVG